MSTCTMYRKKQAEQAVLYNSTRSFAVVLKITSEVNPFDTLSLFQGNEPLSNLVPLTGVKRSITLRLSIKGIRKNKIVPPIKGLRRHVNATQRQSRGPMPPRDVRTRPPSRHPPNLSNLPFPSELRSFSRQSLPSLTEIWPS